MKKTKLFLLGLVSLPLMMTAQQSSICSNCEQAPNITKASYNYDKALWDIQLNVPPASIAPGLAGVAWTGTEFWVAEWASNTLYTLDATGAVTGTSFTIPGITGTRSITTDGTSMYIGTAGTSIYEVDMVTKTLLSTINTSVASCRYVTFDPNLDSGNGGFWTGAFGSDIISVDMSGTTLSTITAATHGLTIYGMAHDPYSAGGPYLWAFDQNGNGSNIVQLSMTGVPTGTVRDAGTDFGVGLGGGLFICNNFSAGNNSMMGISQGVSLFSYELSDPLPIDVQMDALDFSTYVAAGNVTINGTIRNVGLNTITSVDIAWNTGAGANNETFTVNIPSNGTYNFSHATPLVAAAGTAYSVDVTATLTGDGNTANNSLTQNTTALTSIPAKTVVGEEKTGTWCPWCPRGTVGMAFMEAEADFIGIAVHNADPMTIAAYDGSIGTYVPGGYPGGGVDRVIDTDPGAAAFLSVHNARKTAVVPCGVNSIDARFDDATGMISVSAVAEFFGNITGNFRLSCVIVQDDLESTDNGWAQANNYAGGGNGAMAMPNGGYDFGGATSPSSVVASAFGGYDHVARSLSNNDILGDAGSLPAGTVTTGIHNHTFADVNISSMPGVNSAPFVREDAHAVVMIIDVNTGEILNASKANINAPVSVEDVNTSEFNLQVFPNPTNDIASISFKLDETTSVSLEVFNSVGSLVYVENATTMNAGTRKITFNGTELPNGIYFANLKVGEQIITKKISLIK